MADGEAQTTFTIDPQDDAVFVTLHELKQIKEEKDSLDALVQDSMETVDILKRKVLQSPYHTHALTPCCCSMTRSRPPTMSCTRSSKS